MIESEIFQNEKLLKVFIYCLLKASHSDYSQLVGMKLINLSPGQFIFGRSKAAAELNMKESTVWVYMKLLEKVNTISLNSNNKFTVVTIDKWEDYQSLEDNLKQQNNNKKTTKKQQNNTNKNGKNVKNDKNISSSHKYEICDMEMAELLFQRMKENNPTVKQPNLESWAKEVRLMRERDNRTIEQIKYLINWCQQDPFWQSNILSISKLRKQWDQLVIKCRQDKERKNKKIPQKQVRKEDFDLSDD